MSLTVAHNNKWEIVPVNYYQVRYCCNNCGFSFYKKEIYGRLAPQKITCPICGCYSAVKDWGPKPPTPRPVPIRPNQPPWRRRGALCLI